MNASHLIDRLKDVDTPALIVEVGAASENARSIAAACSAHGLRWRPHIKGLKTPALLELLESVGANGFTCSKLGEAEALVSVGFDDILIANQIVGPIKIGRLITLLRTGARATVAVDSDLNVAQLGAATANAGLTLPVVIEIDVGMRRAGVSAPDAVPLAQKIASTNGLQLAGVTAWEGHTARLLDAAQKTSAVHAALATLVGAADAIRAIGLPVDIVSCSGTGTYPIAAAVPGITEIQAGGGVLHDVAYETLYGIDHRHALFVLSAVTSRPTPTRIICDAGKKTLSTDTAMPRPVGLPRIREIRFSAEHGIIELEAPNATPAIGDRILFVVGYGDMTVHLHEAMVAVSPMSVNIWPISARGRSA